MWKKAQIEAQNARGKFRESMWEDENWVAEMKYDGDRRITQFIQEEDLVRFTGRKASVNGTGFVDKTGNLPHLYPFPKNSGLDGTVLDGEIIVDPDLPYSQTLSGGMSKYVTSIMGSLPDRAVALQEKNGKLLYAVFDCLWFEGDDIRHLPWITRQMYREKALARWNNPSVRSVKAVHFLKQAYLDGIYAAGGEGIILKEVQAKYGKNYGGHLKWVKVKRELTADVVITGFKKATQMSEKVDGTVSITKYAANGWIGAIIGSQKIGTNWVEMASVSGIDEQLREEISKNPGKFLGRVMRITANEREPTGKFRHPRFESFRDDKNVEDCVYDPNER